LVEESLTNVKYSDVHQFMHGRAGNKQWLAVGINLLIVSFAIIALRYIYHLPQVIDETISKMAQPLLIISLLPDLLVLLKEDVIYLTNSENNMLDYLKVNKKNKKNVRQILELINSKSPAKEKGGFDSIKHLLD
jgi:hypothetical protein